MSLKGALLASDDVKSLRCLNPKILTTASVLGVCPSRFLL